MPSRVYRRLVADDRLFGLYSRTLKTGHVYGYPRYGRWSGSRPRQLLVYRAFFLVSLPIIAPHFEKPEIIGGATRTIARKCPIFPAFYGRSGKKSLLSILMANDSYEVLQQSYNNARINADTYRAAGMNRNGLGV